MYRVIGKQSPTDLYFCAGKLRRFFLVVQVKDIIFVLKYVVRTIVLDADMGAVFGSFPHRGALEHFFVRASKRMDIQGARAVGDFADEALGVLRPDRSSE